MLDVALASCVDLPEPDPDEAPLLAALRAAGLAADTRAWDDDATDWTQMRLVVLRATWNYFEDLDRFLAWTSRVAAVATLHNPVDVVAWNTHKRYLLELADRGVATVPTALIPRGSGANQLQSVCREREWADVVVKPAVSAASFNTHRMAADALDDARFGQLVAERDMLVQPFVESVRDHGERSIVAIDGELTHSVRKAPRFGDDAESITGPHPIADADAELARAALAAVPTDAPLMYARIDVVHDADGAPLIAELELTEPSLFFEQSANAIACMVGSIERALSR